MEFKSMLTLTYGSPSPARGDEVKRHLNNVLTWLRRRFGVVEYLWFLEFQRRGAPHFHILLDVEPMTRDRFELANYWSRGVAKKWPGLEGATPDDRARLQERMFRVAFHEKSWEAIQKSDGVSRYVTKYATKIEQKTVPKRYENVGRFWGVSRGVIVPDVAEEPVTEDELRQELANLDHPAANWDVVPKYLFIFRGDGERE
jgi:hypothetical protein